MSRAFVKEDAPSEDVIIPARAPLPPGTPNYVTPRGLRLLNAERERLQTQLDVLKVADTSSESQERDHARQLTLLSEQLVALNERLVSAQVVSPEAEAEPKEVAFGSSVTVRVLNGKFAGDERSFSIVGVDEAAEQDEALIAFTAPIARALMGCKLGEQVTFEVARRKQTLELIALGGPDD